MRQLHQIAPLLNTVALTNRQLAHGESCPQENRKLWTRAVNEIQLVGICWLASSLILNYSQLSLTSDDGLCIQIHKEPSSSSVLPHPNSRVDSQSGPNLCTMRLI